MSEPAIEVVRGRLGGERAEEVMAFWSERGALAEEAAAKRLREVVCLIRGEDGRVAGVNSVYRDRVEVVAGREFWVYRSLLDPSLPPDSKDRMMAAAHAALEADFDPAAGDPAGLCLMLDDREWLDRRPEAEWREPRTLYAGYAPDGRQVRVAYFEGAKIGPGTDLGGMTELDPQLGSGYRISLFAEQDEVSGDDVVRMWQAEGAVVGGEAERRIDELLLVGQDESGAAAGVSSAYLQHNRQLGMDLWYYRAFVSAPHRGGNLAVQLALQGRDLLEQRFVEGEDRRGSGIVYEVENEGLKRYFNDAVWFPTDVIFIGENARGDHVRVRYFPGVPAPAAPEAG